MPASALARRLGMAGARAVLPEEAALAAAGGTQGQQQQSENRERASNHCMSLAHRRPAREPLCCNFDDENGGLIGCIDSEFCGKR